MERRPLVVVDGRIKALPPGDTFPNISRFCIFTLSNGTPSNIPLLSIGIGYDIPFTLASGATSNIPTAVT